MDCHILAGMSQGEGAGTVTLVPPHTAESKTEGKSGDYFFFNKLSPGFPLP